MLSSATHMSSVCVSPHMIKLENQAQGTANRMPHLGSTGAFGSGRARRCSAAAGEPNALTPPNSQRVPQCTAAAWLCSGGAVPAV